ncbi:helix-turn-helix domain-containing protein [Moritella dasanensis]|uniref:helix-turn-helix domain-containing protein n=1 Tax=Moritella dasanensis TaxID=428031 RepID=UPI00030D93F7|nr:helix-turn-helix domain-containing protein [Moritella dasanensis]
MNNVDKNFVVLLDKLLLEHKSEVSDGLFKNLETLLSDLKKKGVSFTGINKYQPVLIYGKSNLSRLLKQYVDPHLFAMQDALHKHLYLDISLTESSLIDFKYGQVTEYCDNLQRVAKRLSDNVELNIKYNATSDISFIRIFLLNIHSLVSTDSFKTCKVCFRRILSKRYCWLHKSDDNKFYNQTIRVTKFKNVEMNKFIEKWKAKRAFLGDHPHLIAMESGQYSGTQGELINADETSVAIPEDIYNLIKSFSQPTWIDGGEAIESFIKHELPLVNRITEEQTKKVDSFSKYVKRIYKSDFLDNRYETSVSELWFFFTLLDAECWLEARIEAEKEPDLRMKNTVERDNEIMKLREEGMSYRKIGKEINISKSLVEKVCKSIA